MERKLPDFPIMPDPGYEEIDQDGEWKDSHIGYLSVEDEMSGKYRRKAVTNEMKRKYFHELIDYFADVAEIGPVCGRIEDRAILIYSDKVGQLTLAVVEKTKEDK